ncbi:rano class II histocompatibility antigen, A beta chain-like [Cheilinus undulatus]|uniref:rano class II histocompatibility antigen, A beta chain-like n=1 Tax=Cheilinus undulatus TaxID=241271 RepID=UPI001BD3AC3A|nr:rano class II histocompatibility antigen, A beta chain-like [Cheilinus undulatus]
MNTRSFFTLLSLLLFSRADALFGVLLMHCKFTSLDDAEYLGQIFYNKMLWGEYNSTVGKYVGFTEKAKEIAEELNKNPAFLKEEQRNLEKCKTHVPLALELLSRPVEPSVRLRLTEATDSKHPHMFVCSAYGFYPKQISLKWLRNGKEVTSDVTFTEELPDGNWFYQIHSHLELTLTAEEKIACVVDHDSFQQPMIYEWDPLSEADKTKIAAGASVLVLGMVFLGAGLIYYKKNRHGRLPVPTTQPTT